MRLVFPLVAIVGIGVGLAGGAFAQQVSSDGPITITITKADCSRLVRHTPSPDVAYKPGVDVRGRPVASADADPQAAALASKLVPEVLEFPLNINPVHYAGRKAAYASKSSTEAAIAAGGGTATAAQSQALASAEGKLARYSAKGLDNTSMSLGTIRYDMARGAFTLNGEPLTSEDQQKLSGACAKQGVR